VDEMSSRAVTIAAAGLKRSRFMEILAFKKEIWLREK